MRSTQLVSATTRCIAISFIFASSAIAQTHPTTGPSTATKDLIVATQAINDLYKQDILAARTRQQQIDLAKKFLAVARKTTDNRAGRQVLLAKARDIAAQAGDLATAFSAIAEWEKTNPGDSLAMKLEATITASRLDRLMDVQASANEAAGDLLDAALIADRYDLAARAAGVALSTAKHLGDPALAKCAAARAEQIQLCADQFKKLAPALATLKATPQDPAANLAVGEFLCLFKSDWEHGLPLLAASSDATLSAIAADDIAAPESPPIQVALGDRWWNLGEKQPRLQKINIQQHACKWYQTALPSMDGLAKAKLEKRITDNTAESSQAHLVNLLEMVNVDHDSMTGKWHFDNGQLSNEPAGAAQFSFPYLPPAEYDCHVVYDRQDVKWGMGFILFKSDTQFVCEMPTQAEGGNRVLLSFNPDVKARAPVKAATHGDVRVQIRNDRVTIFLNGEKVLDRPMVTWDLPPRPSWMTPQRFGMGLFDFYGRTTFFRVEITEISGPGKRLDTAITGRP